jgi:hypothetical protein
MKAILSIFSFCILFSTQCLTAQNFTLYGDKTFGGSNSEKYVQLLKFSENNLFIAGNSTTTSASGDKTDPNCNNNQASNNNDVWALMFDINFNIIWNKRYGGESSEGGINSIIKTSGNEIIFGVQSSSDSSCEKSENNWSFQPDYWICRIDSNGNKIMDKTFGAFGTESIPHIVQLTTGDFIIAGISNSTISGDKSVANWGGIDYWVVKFDSLGNKIWDNVYGGTGTEVALSGENFTETNLLADDNGSFLLSGRSNSPVSGNISVPGFGGHDIWIIKIDSAGNKIWDNRFGGSSSTEFCSQIIHAPGGYIIVGATSSPQGGSISDPQIGLGDVWVIKLDSFGNKVWDRRYGGTGNDRGISIAIAPDGGYWISASTESPAGFDISEPSYGLSDYWMLKIDSVGNKLWDKRFGGPGYDFASNFVIMPDSSIFLAGYADVGESVVKTDFGKGMNDYWVVHFKYPDYSVGINEADAGNYLKVFPNPAENVLSFSNSKFEIANITLIDMQGRVIKEMNINNKSGEMDVSNISNGLYLLKIKYSNNTSTISKISIIH